MVVWEESVGEWGPGVLEALSRIEYPRKLKGVRHPLSAVLALSVCAMLSGARSLYAIAQWGWEHPQFAQSLGFRREQTLCEGTLHHVFRQLDADAYELALGRWAQDCLGEDCLREGEGEGEGEAAIAIEGKALRGLHGRELAEAGLAWPGTGLLGGTDPARRQWRRGKETVELSYAITSLPPERADADRLLEIWRGHWGMENRLHWVRDVIHGEDQSWVRTESAPQLLAALGNLVIGMLRLCGVKNISAALRHYSWKPWETLSLIGLPYN